ncbi:MAG: M23 family metallopeptidase [Chloroflexota bacterium]|nr:M23 family metallopeptidase [Chloroflexota bacterium]
MRLSLPAAIVACLLAAGLIQATPSTAHAEGEFVWPTEGRLTQPYGCTGFWAEPRRGSCRHFHSGADIANEAGTPIVAPASGEVTIVGWNPYDRPGQRAWVVVIKHDAGFTGWYAHMQARHVPGVEPGERVRAGQLIGYMGDTGRSTGVHLHFSFMRDGEPINPLRYLPPGPPAAGQAESDAAALQFHAVAGAVFATGQAGARN